MFVWLRLELLLHVAQLLDEGCEGDSLLGLLVPAPAHQLINLLAKKRGMAVQIPRKAVKCDACVCLKEGASHRLRTAVRTGQPPPLIQHLHQTHDRHLTLGPADHVQETLQGQNQRTRYRAHAKTTVVSICGIASAEDLHSQRTCSVCLVVRHCSVC